VNPEHQEYQDFLVIQVPLMIRAIQQDLVIHWVQQAQTHLELLYLQDFHLGQLLLADLGLLEVLVILVLHLAQLVQ
jgi:uncharacterized protein with NAD-binding domain and iron-sulfur cluster